MYMFEQTFLAARDGDLSPFDSWRRRKLTHAYPCFEVGLLKPLESLTVDDYHEQLLLAAESRAVVAWFSVRFTSDMRDAITLWSSHIRGYHEPAQHILGQVGAVWNTGVVHMLTGLFHPDHKAPEDRAYATLEHVEDLITGLRFKRT